jgi:hypothetical protein
MFTDRYVRLPIRVYNEEEKELTGNEHQIDSYEMVNPFRITSYRPGEDDDNSTCITFDSGENMLVYWNIRQFERVMNDHFKKEARG